MPGVVLVNPGSGPGDTDLSDLRRRFAGHHVQERKPADIPGAVVEAIRDGVDFVAVAGGDGTIRCAAEQLAESGVALLPIPAGTRNHFAHDVGVDDLDAATAAVHGQRIVVDLGRVNGRHFVNNASLGLYPRLVARRRVHQRRLPKALANMVAAYEQLRYGKKVAVEVDSSRYVVWMVFVGNDVYGDGLFDLVGREHLDGHILDLRIVLADRRLARLRVLGAVLFGRLARSPLVLRQETNGVTLRLDRPEVEVALDGEVETLETPLVFESVRDVRTVLTPP